MPDYILLMHSGPGSEDPTSWGEYIDHLGASGLFRGGSAIGDGVSVRKTGEPPSITQSLTGFIRIEADDLEHARRLAQGNPCLEAGGTVEIRELPETD